MPSAGGMSAGREMRRSKRGHKRMREEADAAACRRASVPIGLSDRLCCVPWTDPADARGSAGAPDVCSDDNYYVVKFQNNPQHRRVLVNEMLGTRLASRLGLPTAPVSVVEVPEELIR